MTIDTEWIVSQLHNITSDSFKTAPTWRGAVDAIRGGHLRPKALITDSFLERGQNRLLTRAASIEGLGSAVKTFSVHPDNPKRDPALPSVQGACMLFEEGTGTPSAMVDFSLLTYWKTAADSVLGAMLVGPAEPRHLVVIGAGQVAKSLCEAYAALFPTLERITVCARRLEAAELCANSLSPPTVELAVSNQPETIVPSADIVATATTSETPILKGDWLKDGTHVDLVGAYSGTMREADDTVLRRGTLYVDSKETTIDHIGELKIPIAAGLITPSDVQGDLYDLVSAASSERRSTITIFKNGGGAHLDLMISHYLYGLT